MRAKISIKPQKNNKKKTFQPSAKIFKKTIIPLFKGPCAAMVAQLWNTLKSTLKGDVYDM